MASLKLTAFGLRGASAAAKFLLVTYVASAAGATLLGQVAIMTTLTALFTQVAGLEINQVVGRRLHGLQIQELTRTLRGQTAACLCAYAVLLPIAFFAYPDLLLPHWLCVGPILILEHFITEVYRLNILLLRPVFASCLLFVKNAGWVILFIGLTATGTAQASFALLLYCWSGVLLFTSLPLLVKAWHHHAAHEGAGTIAAFRNAPALVREALPFVASAMLTAGTGAFDKLMISKVFEESSLGVYFFFSTCASILTLVVAFSVGSIAGPECIKIYATHDRAFFQARLRRLKRQYWTTVLATSAAILTFAWPLLGMFKKDMLAQHFSILVCLVIGAAFASLCDPYKLNEYLSKRDSSLVIGNSFQLICLVLAVGIGSLTTRLTVVAFGVMLSSFMTFLFFSLDGPRRSAQVFRLRREI